MAQDGRCPTLPGTIDMAQLGQILNRINPALNATTSTASTFPSQYIPSAVGGQPVYHPALTHRPDHYQLSGVTITSSIPATAPISTIQPSTQTGTGTAPVGYVPSTGSVKSVPPPLPMELATQVPSSQTQGQISQAQIPSGYVPQAQVPQAQVQSVYVPQVQVPQAQIPPGYVPPAQVQSVYVPPGQVPQAQVPPGYVPQAQVPPGYIPQGQVPQSQIPPSQTTSTTSTSTTLVPPESFQISQGVTSTISTSAVPQLNVSTMFQTHGSRPPEGQLIPPHVVRSIEDAALPGLTGRVYGPYNLSPDVLQKVDRLRGAFYGLAVGDALGEPFRAYGQPYRVYQSEQVRANPSLKMLPGRKYVGQTFAQFNEQTLAPGQTGYPFELTALVSASLIQIRGFNDRTLVQAFQMWAKTLNGKWMKPNDFVLLFNKTENYEKYRSNLDFFMGGGQIKYDSNTSFIYALPMIFNPALVQNLVGIVQPSEITVQAVGIYVNFLRMIFEGKSKQEIITLLQNHMGGWDINLRNIIRDAVLKNQRLMSGGEIYSYRQFLYTVFYAYFHFDNLGDALDWAIFISNGNNGVDAAVCGAVGMVMGLSLGFDRIIQDPDFRVNLHTVGTVDPSRGTTGQRQYTVGIIENLVVGLFSLGTINLV